jgi:hypothetical protein
VVGLALAVYAGIVVSCQLQGGDQATSGPGRRGGPHVKLEGVPFRGVAMQIQRTDWIDRYKKSIDEIVELGADTFLCIVDARQENGSSARIYLDMRMTPTPEQLSEILKYAKEKKLRVILMPIVLLDSPRGDEWRGKINPGDGASWAEWFESYRAMATHYAWVAQLAGVDIFVVGSELVSTESKAEEWAQTIKAIRTNFKGLLTYSSNWDHYSNIPFWDDLDVIGMNSYWKLGEDRNVKVEEIVKNWQEIQKELREFTQKKNKPLLFTEVGWCSLENAASEPWDYTRTDKAADADLQKRLWDGFFRAWHGDPMLAGFTIWAWSPNDGGPDAEKDYSLKGKPAYALVKKWLVKPWNEK